MVQTPMTLSIVKVCNGAREMGTRCDARHTLRRSVARPGQTTDVQVDTYGQTIRGKVESLSGGTGARFSLVPPENATGNFVKVAQRIPVRIALDRVPSGMALGAGQSVVVTVHVGD
jgi:multidrug resistance efflux pump